MGNIFNIPFNNKIWNIDTTKKGLIAVTDDTYIFYISNKNDIEEMGEYNVPKLIVDIVKKLLNEKNKK